MDNPEKESPMPGPEASAAQGQPKPEEEQNHQEKPEAENTSENNKEEEQSSPEKEKIAQKTAEIIADLDRQKFSSEVLISIYKAKLYENKKLLTDIQDHLNKNNIALDLEKTFLELDKIRPDLISDELNNPEAKEMVENVIYDLVMSDSLDAEVINSLLENITISKEKGVNSTGYEEVALYSYETKKITLHPELFEKGMDTKHVLLHEISHALAKEPNLIYSTEEIKNFSEVLKNPDSKLPLPEDLNLIKQIVDKPEDFVGTQGIWIDKLLQDLIEEKDEKQKLRRKPSITDELLAEQLSLYLASGKKNEAMLYKHLHRLGDENLKKLKEKVLPEDLEAFDKLLSEPDKDKAEELARKYPILQKILLQNKVFFDRFNAQLGKDPKEMLKIISDNKNTEENEEDEFYGGGFAGEPQLGEGSELGSSRSSSGNLLGEIAQILEPLKQII